MTLRTYKPKPNVRTSEQLYHHHMGKHYEHWEEAERHPGNPERADYQYGKAEEHAQKAEEHAFNHFKKTGQKIRDIGYTGSSPYVIGESVMLLNKIKRALAEEHPQDTLGSMHKNLFHYHDDMYHQDPRPDNQILTKKNDRIHGELRRQSAEKHYNLTGERLRSRHDGKLYPVPEVREAKTTHAELAAHHRAQAEVFRKTAVSQFKQFGDKAGRVRERYISYHSKQAYHHEKLAASELGEATEKKKNAKIQAWHWTGAKKVMGAKYGGFDHTTPVSQIPSSMEFNGKRVNPRNAVIYVAQHFANKDKNKLKEGINPIKSFKRGASGWDTTFPRLNDLNDSSKGINYGHPKDTVRNTRSQDDAFLHSIHKRHVPNPDSPAGLQQRVARNELERRRKSGKLDPKYHIKQDNIETKRVYGEDIAQPLGRYQVYSGVGQQMKAVGIVHQTHQHAWQWAKQIKASADHPDRRGPHFIHDQDTGAIHSMSGNIIGRTK